MLRSERAPEAYLDDLPSLRSGAGPAGPAPERLPPPDASRYRLDPPADLNDLEAWRAAGRNARAQLEHQRGRVVNLELLHRRGEELWQETNARVEAACVAVGRELAAERRRSEATNRERKLQQLAAGSELRRLEAEWYAQVSRNADVGGECRAMEREIDLLRAQLPRAAEADGPGGVSGDAGGD